MDLRDKGRQARRLLLASDGVSALEFALVAPFLALLVIGIVDFGIALWRQTEVGGAANAGAEYAAIHGWNQSAIASAVKSATGFAAISASPAPSEVCGCPDPNAGIVQQGTPPCTLICSDGSSAGTYAIVSAQAQYATVLPYPGIADPLTLSASAIARLK